MASAELVSGRVLAALTGRPACGPTSHMPRVARSCKRKPLRVCPSMNLAAGVSTKKLYRNAHLTLERAPRLGVADMNATMTARRGLRVAELAAAVVVSADTIRYYERTGLLLAPARTPSGYRATRRPVRLVRTIAR
jgi:hypothetical protein